MNEEKAPPPPSAERCATCGYRIDEHGTQVGCADLVRVFGPKSQAPPPPSAQPWGTQDGPCPRCGHAERHYWSVPEAVCDGCGGQCRPVTPPPGAAMSEERKTCTGCGGFFPLAGFYKEARARDGRRSICKGCDSTKGKKWRDAAREHKRVYDRRYRKTLPIETKRAMFKRQQKTRQPKRTVEQRRRRALNPERSRANHTVRRGVAMGVLTKPDKCQRCGAGGRIEGSHSDYLKPLDVEWLCVPCHRTKDGVPGFAAAALDGAGKGSL